MIETVKMEEKSRDSRDAKFGRGGKDERYCGN